MKKFLRNALILVSVISFGLFSACNISSDIEGGTSDSDSSNSSGSSNSGNSSSNSSSSGSSDSSSSSDSSERPDDDNDVTEVEVDDTVYDTTLMESDDNGTYTFDDGTGSTVSFTVSYSEGTDKCYSLSEDGTTLTFSGFAADSVYSITGSFYGNIVIDAGDDYEFELEFTDFSLTSYTECPLYIASGDKVTISAKKNTENYIFDMRDEVTDEDGISASIYALCDLDIQGKGNLYIKSVNNNGVHTKDDLEIKNVILQVECEDNALKGNDSVTIQSGTIVLIARTGDGIKTTNSDVSSKGNQRGTITVSGGDVLIYAACDGMDAAYNVEINEDASTTVVQIFTDKYSEYSEEVTATTEDIYYIRYTSTSYKYSIRYFNDDEEVWYNSSSYETVTSSGNGSLGGIGGMMGGMSTKYYYYPIVKPSGYSKMQIYVYSSSQTQGQSSSYTAASDTITVNDNYDTIALSANGNRYTFSWTNYSTSISNGMGGMVDSGNTDKGDYSTKGIKAANEIAISAGTVTISSYDDSIHANNETELENGDTPTGNVTITGGTVTVYSNDDGIHADGTTLISGGSVTVSYSYEGIEGNVVKISGGTTSVTASDDGVNGTGTSGESIVISGGYLYVYAGGDAVDSNSMTSKDGLLFSGGYSVLISTGASDSSIDTENGYKYTGGYVLGIDSGDMTQEATNCSNFSSIGVSKTYNLTKGNYLTVSGYVTVKIPVSISGAHVVFLGYKSASISTSASSSLSLDSNGVYWSV